jgi:hypothetical protein
MPPVKKNKGELSQEEIALLGISYLKLKDSEKELKKGLENTRKSLEEYLKTNGKPWEKGEMVSVTHAGKQVNILHSNRVSKTMVPTYEEILQKHGLKECLESVLVFREDVFESMYEAGKIPIEVVEELFEEKVSKVFSVKID